MRPLSIAKRICLISLATALASGALATLASAGSYTEVADAHGAPVRLYSEEMGHGPPLLLIHGLGGSMFSWYRVGHALARSNRVIALDLKGFGRSDKPLDDAYSAVDQAHLVAQFIVRRNLHRVTLAGHSFGGQVAVITTLVLNRQSPGRIARLALIDAPALPQPLTPFVAFLQQPVLPYAVLAVLPPELPVRLAITPANGNPSTATEADIAAQAAPFHEFGAKHALISTARDIVPPGFPGIIARYRTIRQPTLVLWCDDDPVVPLETGRRLARMLPNARLSLMHGCDHVPQWNSPREFARRLSDFAH